MNGRYRENPYVSIASSTFPCCYRVHFASHGRLLGLRGLLLGLRIETAFRHSCNGWTGATLILLRLEPRLCLPDIVLRSGIIKIILLSLIDALGTPSLLCKGKSKFLYKARGRVSDVALLIVILSPSPYLDHLLLVAQVHCSFNLVLFSCLGLT